MDLGLLKKLDYHNKACIKGIACKMQVQWSALVSITTINPWSANTTWIRFESASLTISDWHFHLTFIALCLPASVILNCFLDFHLVWYDKCIYANLKQTVRDCCTLFLKVIRYRRNTSLLINTHTQETYFIYREENIMRIVINWRHPKSMYSNSRK